MPRSGHEPITVGRTFVQQNGQRPRRQRRGSVFIPDALLNNFHNFILWSQRSVRVPAIIGLAPLLSGYRTVLQIVAGTIQEGG
jgi:hypothetical protein